MGDESMLERILDGDEKPTDLPLALLQRITENFSEDRKIGQGGFGEVYKGVLRNGIVAVKRIHVSVSTIDDKLFRREFSSLRKINHQNVVRFLGFCSNTYQTPIEEAGSDEINLANIRERLFCFEYISNGSLDKHITDELRGLEWETRYEIILGICKGLYYLQKEIKILHMDLKPANVLLDDHMVPKITDFGLSRPDKSSHTVGHRFGTRGYLAPEYETAGKTSIKSDIYSLGAIIIELVTGCKGIPDKNKVLRRWRHRWSKPPTLLQYTQVTRCIEIAVRCRVQDPEHRPSISEIIKILSEFDSTDGHTSQISPGFDEDDMLGIQPLELRLPSEPNKISCLIELTNDTCNCIAFNIQTSSLERYIVEPIKGIVQPISKCDVKITVHPQDVHHAEKFIVLSMKASEYLRVEDITERTFEEAAEVVDEVHLMVVYEPTKPQDNCKSRDGTNMPPKVIKKLCSNKNVHPLQSFSRHYPTNMIYLDKESDRAVDLARGAMGSLLDKLGKLVKEDYNMEACMKRDIESLSEELMKMHLDTRKLQNLEGVKVWVDQVRELSYNIEDMVDGFLVHIEPNSDRRGFGELTHKSLKLLENGMMNYHQIGDVIRDIKNQVQVVADRKNKYNFDINNVVANCVTAKAAIDPRISAIYEDKEQLIGIQAPRDELIRLFEEDSDVSMKKLKIVSIVGLGGLGKTTLAKAVYDKLQAQYRPRAFVPVGQNPDVKKVLNNILFEFGKDFHSENLELFHLIKELQEFLKNKRYFIVIDDIWDSSSWDLIISAFPRNDLGSRVITTTRIEHVARACCKVESRYIYRIKPLNDDDSRKLFFRRIFGPEKDCPVAQKKISFDILKRCGGMPLAINSIASLLAGEPESTWDYVRKTLGAMIEGNDLENMKQILDLSYIHLPDHLKTCLLYVCMYPEDDEIDKNDLLRQWVAESFVSTKGGLDAEDVAEKYFKDLINMCMIQPGKVGYNNEVLSCRVHDIILDLMRSKSSEKNFVHIIDGSKDETGSHAEVRRVSIHYNEYEEDMRNLATTKGSLSHVRSVFLYQGSLLPLFLVFKYVRVLHLEDRSYSMGLDLTSISGLFLLRYLKIACAGLSENELKLPEEIGELQQLETIDLDGGILKSYPLDIVSLPRLSHLRYGAGIELPDGIEKLQSLHTLGGVCVYRSSVQNIKGLGKLTNLRNLQICSRVFSQSEQATTMRMDALHSSIFMISANLKILTLGEGSSIKLDAQDWSMTLFPQGSHIRELDLSCCNFERCPEWIGQLHNLSSFRITVMEVADGVSIVAGLPSLAYLELQTQVFGEEKEESVVIPGGGAFQALTQLTFFCKKASLTFNEGAMPKLEVISILFRYHMTHQFLPVGIEHLPARTLQKISLVIAGDEMRQLRVEGSQDWDNHDWDDYYKSDEYNDDLRQNARIVGPLLKRAFKLHHPGANIIVLFEGDEIEDDDNEDGKPTSINSQSWIHAMATLCFVIFPFLVVSYL